MAKKKTGNKKSARRRRDVADIWTEIARDHETTRRLLFARQRFRSQIESIERHAASDIPEVADSARMWALRFRAGWQQFEQKLAQSREEALAWYDEWFLSGPFLSREEQILATVEAVVLALEHQNDSTLRGYAESLLDRVTAATRYAGRKEKRDAVLRPTQHPWVFEVEPPKPKTLAEWQRDPKFEEYKIQRLKSKDARRSFSPTDRAAAIVACAAKIEFGTVRRICTDARETRKQRS